MSVQDEVKQSRITLKYRTEIDGEPAAIDLPLRLMILADFSQGTSKDRKLDLDARVARNLDGSNTADIMKDMNISLDLTVPNKIGGSGDIDVKLSIDSIDSFSPQEVARQVPQIQSLVLFKKLLEEIQSNLANKKEFAQLLNKLFSNKAALEKIRGEIKHLAPTLPKKQIGHSDSKPEKQGMKQ